METIILREIKKCGTVIKFDFSVSRGLAQYFSGKEFVIEYPECIESVPDAVAAVPFVCNVLPIIWLTDSKLILKELDKDFFDCIPNVKAGYETMFPESIFAGELCIERVVKSNVMSTGGSAVFFSGGLDAVNTLINHLDEKPALISIWGSDIQYENISGWKKVHEGSVEYSDRFDLPDVVIRSSFRVFDDEGALHKAFSEQLKDGWWHGVKHGIGLLGHAAPYAYLKGLSNVYIASSNCPADGPVRCASSPIIDNHVRFAKCQIIHDGFEYSRQDKARNVVEFRRVARTDVTLHVCWESQEGGNCCRCEKCYRTMIGLLAEGADPVEYGFTVAPHTIPKMKVNLLNSSAFTPFIAETQWTHIQNRIHNNAEMIKKQPYWKHIKWIAGADFSRIETIKLPLTYKICRRMSRTSFCRILRAIKEKL